MATRYGKAASKTVKTVMHERKHGTLKSGSGRKVTSKKQAIAIALSEARRAGAKVPKQRRRRRRRRRETRGRNSRFPTDARGRYRGV